MHSGAKGSSGVVELRPVVGAGSLQDIEVSGFVTARYNEKPLQQNVLARPHPLGGWKVEGGGEGGNGVGWEGRTGLGVLNMELRAAADGDHCPTHYLTTPLHP